MKLHLASLLCCLTLVSSSLAADYRVEVLKESAPADAVSAEIAETLAPTGIRVFEGKDTFCDIWLCQEWKAKDDFEPSPTVLYPFTPGQLIGVIRFAEEAEDFREQEVEEGVYTLRYAQQPVDGAHIGTSIIRDFLLVVSAEQDESPELLGYDDLTLQSAEAAGSTHPALFAMQRVPEAERPAIRNREDFDWWIVGFEGKTKKGKKLPVELVIVGAAIE